MRIRKQYQVIPTNAKLENGDSTSATNGYTAEYINDHSVVVSAVEPSGSARKKVWMQKGKNLISADNIIAGLYGISSGAYSSSDSARCTKNMIEIDNTKNYVLSTGSSSSSIYMYVMYYNASGTYLGYTGGTLNNSLVLNTYSNYSNAKFINLRFDTTYIPEMMLEEGNTKTTYEDYTAKTYTLDDTIYREFINNQPVILYDNPTGTIGNITLSDSVANYNYIEIYFMDNSGYSRFERYYNVNGKTVDLGILRLNNITNKQLKLTSKNVTISGTSITNGDAIVSYIKLDATVTGDSYTTNELSITRVLGYK